MQAIRLHPEAVETSAHSAIPLQRLPENPTKRDKILRWLPEDQAIIR